MRAESELVCVNVLLFFRPTVEESGEECWCCFSCKLSAWGMGKVCNGFTSLRSFFWRLEERCCRISGLLLVAGVEGAVPADSGMTIVGYCSIDRWR